MKGCFQEYCKKTSIHGFSYFNQRERSTFEKVWWAVMMITCLCICVYVVMIMYLQFVSSPIILSFATKSTPLYDIPFPAVTICPVAKTVGDRLNYTNLKKVITEKGPAPNAEQLKHFEYMSLLCHEEEKLHTNFIYNTTDFFNLIYKVKPSLIENSVLCIWMGKTEFCKNLFTETLTDEGICYTFNSLRKSEIFRENTYVFEKLFMNEKPSAGWNLDDGYTQSTTTDTYPHRALLPGSSHALVVYTRSYNNEDEYLCSSFIKGFKIALHLPAQIPIIEQSHFLVPVDHFVIASVEPSMVITSQLVQKYHPHVRMCYFPRERHLRFFKLYTQQNCRAECLANYTLKSCGCVKFFMPRTAETPICGLKMYQCTKAVEEEVEHNMLQMLRSTFSSTECDCLPLCTDITYNWETSQAPANYQAFYVAHVPSYKIDPHTHVTGVKIYFKSAQFLAQERNEIFGPIGFLANFGGIIALFTGASILSVVEVLYYLTCKIFFKRRLLESRDAESQTK